MMVVTSKTELHPGVKRALQAASDHQPSAAAAAACSLNRILEGVMRSEAGADAWRSSALARDGFPVEFAFSSCDDSLRYTAEVCGPEVPPGERLSRAEALYEELVDEAIPSKLGAFLHSVQAGGALKYGAWISGRHKGDRSYYKLYAEIPAANQRAAMEWEKDRLGRAPVLPRHDIQLCMVGYQGASDRLELYYDIHPLMPGGIATLLSRVGLGTRASDVLKSLERAYGRPVCRALPCSTFGFSYSISAQGEPESFSLYTFANSLFGGDATIRAALIDLASSQGWDFSLYEQMSRPLAHRRGFITQHGMFGITVSEAGPPAIVFGLTPPEEVL